MWGLGQIFFQLPYTKRVHSAGERSEGILFEILTNHAANILLFRHESILNLNLCFQVSFEYQVLNLDLVESFWTFLIPEHNLSLPFLLVGTANEPVVYIDRSHLNLGSLLLGEFSIKCSILLLKEQFTQK